MVHSASQQGFPYAVACIPSALHRSFHSGSCFPLLRPCSSDHIRYRNLNLLSIGYASQPLLRPRLAGADQLYPWKRILFGRWDSHLSLATHSGILSSSPPLLPVRFGSIKNAPLPMTYVIPQLRCRVSAPVHFSAQGLSTN